MDQRAVGGDPVAGCRLVLHPHRAVFLSLGGGLLVAGLLLGLCVDGSPAPIMVAQGGLFTAIGLRILVSVDEGVLRFRFLGRTRAVPGSAIQDIYPGRRLGGWGLCVQIADGRVIEPWAVAAVDPSAVQIVANELRQALGMSPAPGFLGRLR